MSERTRQSSRSGEARAVASGGWAAALGVAAFLTLGGSSLLGQTVPPGRDDSTDQLHQLQPDYSVPYGAPTEAQVVEVLQRVRNFVDGATPSHLIDARSREKVIDPSKAEGLLAPGPGAFRLVSYEGGVVHSGMLAAAEATGDSRFAQYSSSRLELAAQWARQHRARKLPMEEGPGPSTQVRSILEPRALDDAGAMCAAMIKATRAGHATDLRPFIDNYLDFISTKQLRLADGTLARNRPQPSTIWLDDLYMSVPALAQAGALTGERRYFDDAVKQVLQFSGRMFNRQRGLFMHGWVQDMEVHPEFYWARANGWAILTMVELLDVLPEDHPGRAAVLDLLRAHARGLAAQQSGTGFWHQLLDRTDSYLETSATAIYTYSIARAIDRGWLDAKTYGPMVLLAWNAVATKVNAQGQVEGTCVGTGMAFDPAFYYHRPTNVYAAHGYGPTLLAGAEVLRLLKAYRVTINDSSVQFEK